MSRPRRSVRRWTLGLLLGLGSGAGCSEDSAIVFEEEQSEAMQVGEARVVDVRYLRLDIQGYEETHTLDDLRAMPRRVLEDIWLADLPVEGLFTNALEQIRTLPEDEVQAMPQPARNMHTLLTMTPDNAVLEGTNLQELVSLAGAVGVPPAKALANLLGIEVTDDFIPPEIVTEVMLDQVASSHPNARFRKGPIDEDHPDGLYEVEPGTVPITLADVVTNFENMAERFGPVGDHPGFVTKATGFSVVENEFKMISKVNANALPFKGIDLTDGSVASVNSIGSQIETLHDFSDPDWIRLEGLVEDPTVAELTVIMLEHDTFMPGGTSREPAGQGDSPAWDIPVWEFEHVLAELGRRVAATIPAHCDSYELATGVVAFEACIDEDGWTVLETFNDVGSPPDPAYLWDLELEIGQARLHDGGLAEGEADIELTVRDISVGVSPEELIEKTRQNVQANPEALREFAELLTDSTRGDADFYYIRSEAGEDWLYFVDDKDLRKDDEGEPVRGYDYAHPGFFADPSLSQKISSTQDVDGDVEHEKLKIEPGLLFYVGDDEGRVFELLVLEKPSRAWSSFQLTRVK